MLKAPTPKLTLIVFMEVYGPGPKGVGEVVLAQARYSLWLYPGDLQEAPEDEECGAAMGDWVPKYAVRLQGTWDTMAEAEAALGRSGTKVCVECLCGSCHQA